jgi:hypothetical protein
MEYYLELFSGDDDFVADRGFPPLLRFVDTILLSSLCQFSKGNSHLSIVFWAHVQDSGVIIIDGKNTQYAGVYATFDSLFPFLA